MKSEKQRHGRAATLGACAALLCVIAVVCLLLRQCVRHAHEGGAAPVETTDASDVWEAVAAPLPEPVATSPAPPRVAARNPMPSLKVASIAGTVMDTERRPVTTMVLYCEHEPGQRQRGRIPVQIDADGNYESCELEPGEYYRITATSSGFCDEVQSLMVRPGQVTFCDIVFDRWPRASSSCGRKGPYRATCMWSWMEEGGPTEPCVEQSV